MTGVAAALVNGEPAGVVPVSDRGLLYGDGVFETIAIRNGRLQQWPLHMQRLQAGCARLGIQPPGSLLLATEAENIINGSDHGVLKLIVTRGSGGRGYRAAEHADTTRIMQLHAWPEYPAACSQAGVRVRLCETRLGRNPSLAGIKHLNRLEQVLARREWDDADIHEGLLRDTDGNLIEGTMSNLFIVSDGVLMTPDLSQCGVAGIMRTLVLELAGQLGLGTRIVPIGLETFLRAEEVFLTNSLIGIWPVIALGEMSWRKGRVTLQLQEGLAHSSNSNSGWHE